MSVTQNTGRPLYILTVITTSEEAERIPGKHSNTRIPVKPLPLASGHGHNKPVTTETEILSIGKWPLHIAIINFYPFHFQRIWNSQKALYIIVFESGGDGRGYLISACTKYPGGRSVFLVTDM
jgi:hypothetical protein